MSDKDSAWVIAILIIIFCIFLYFYINDIVTVTIILSGEVYEFVTKH